MNSVCNAYLCEGLRTPIGRYAGALSSVRPDDLLAGVLKELLASAPAVYPAQIDDVFVGCANQAGEDNRNVARMATLLAGLPESVPAITLNRLCGSGLDAVGTAARAIMCGDIDLAIAGGVESMSRAPFVMPKARAAFDRSAELFDTTMGWRFVNSQMVRQFGIDSMPDTAENVAKDYAVSREDQDAFALRSQQRAASAIASGRLNHEIVPVTVPKRRGDDVIVEHDEHPRETTLEKLATLSAPFRENGSVTAGNASGINDGAAAVFVASEKAVAKHGLTPRARIVGMRTVGVEPRVMGIGPAPAISSLLEKHQLSLSDIDVIEINEAFAAQALAVTRMLELVDTDTRVNPNGGAIALGHPLGMSGARLAITASLELQLTTAKRAVCGMCIGVGQGIAVLLESP